MKKFWLILIAFIFTLNSSNAIEETVELQTQEKTLKEKFYDVYHLEAQQTEKPFFLLTDILTKKCSKDSAWDSFHLWGGYVAHTDFIFCIIPNESLVRDSTRRIFDYYQPRQP